MKIFLLKKEIFNSEGQLIVKDGMGIITIDDKITEKGQKKFTIAHELGHYFNSGKKNGSYFCSGLDIRGIKQDITAEVDANDFAAELLMPEDWFVKFTKGKIIGKKLLSESAEYFDISLSAAALRYAEIGNHPVAVIMSKDGSVKWSRINKHFTFHFIRPKSKVNNLSYAYEFFNGEKIPMDLKKFLPMRGLLELIIIKKITSFTSRIYQCISITQF